jgi:hypothetical protein
MRRMRLSVFPKLGYQDYSKKSRFECEGPKHATRFELTHSFTGHNNDLLNVSFDFSIMFCSIYIILSIPST